MVAPHAEFLRWKTLKCGSNGAEVAFWERTERERGTGGREAEEVAKVEDNDTLVCFGFTCCDVVQKINHHGNVWVFFILPELCPPPPLWVERARRQSKQLVQLLYSSWEYLQSSTAWVDILRHTLCVFQIRVTANIRHNSRRQLVTLWAARSVKERDNQPSQYMQKIVQMASKGPFPRSVST